MHITTIITLMKTNKFLERIESENMTSSGDMFGKAIRHIYHLEEALVLLHRSKFYLFVHLVWVANLWHTAKVFRTIKVEFILHIIYHAVIT